MTISSVKECSQILAEIEETSRSLRANLEGYNTFKGTSPGKEHAMKIRMLVRKMRNSLHDVEHYMSETVEW